VQFKIKMHTLGSILNLSRVGVSHLLNDMQERGLLELYRGIIVIPNAARLAD
jgi:CRP-like cAMP-binding protein